MTGDGVFVGRNSRECIARFIISYEKMGFDTVFLSVMKHAWFIINDEKGFDTVSVTKNALIVRFISVM